MTKFKSDAEIMKFARSWLRMMSRFVGKNVRSCLSKNKKGETAWFPALMESCAFFDLLASMYVGKKSANADDVKAYAKKFLTRNRYGLDELDILWSGFRNKIAHQAHPNYVLDTKREKVKGPARRIVFAVTNGDLVSALNLKKEAKLSISSPRPMVPWPVPFDHRITISPLRLQKDLRNSLYGPTGYLKWLENSPKGKNYFVKTIMRFFPP